MARKTGVENSERTPTAGRSLNPHRVDLHVGDVVRVKRKARNISQQALAAAIGITFQQVQKYERGTNRISASKLYEISVYLKVPVQTFFDGLDDSASGYQESASEHTVSSFVRTGEGIQLAEAFPKIGNARLRRRVVELVKTLAEETEA